MDENLSSKRSNWFRPPQFPQWYRSLSSNFRRFFHRKHFVDVIFHCQDNKQVGQIEWLLALGLRRDKENEKVVCHAAQDLRLEKILTKQI